MPSSSSVRAEVSTWVGAYSLSARRFHGHVAWVPSHPERSQLLVEVDMRSLHSSVPLAAKLARSESFLDTERFPWACFRSNQIHWNRANPSVEGELSLHGVTRAILTPGRLTPLPQEVGPHSLLLESRFRVLRDDYSIRSNDFLELLISDYVTVELTLRVQLAAATKFRPWRCSEAPLEPTAPR